MYVPIQQQFMKNNVTNMKDSKERYMGRFAEGIINNETTNDNI